MPLTGKAIVVGATFMGGSSVYRSIVTLAGLCCLALSPAQGADLRERMREAQSGGIQVTGNQASDLTLTLTEAAPRLIQSWIRTVGTVDRDGKTITARLRAAEADGIRLGQRTRSFAANDRTQMHQGKVVRLSFEGQEIVFQASLNDRGHMPGMRYLMEIIVERGPYLSVPNVSIIDEGNEQIVYLEMHPAGSGVYAPRSIRTGLQGELFTEIRFGLFPGDRIVSIGSFFVNAEEKLKSPRSGICTTPLLMK